METTIPTPTPSVAPTPAPAPAPTPAPTPMVVANPTMADGGNISSEGGSEGGVNGFFKDFKWIEIGLLVGGIWGLASMINYYRFKLKQDKLINNELQRQIDEIKMNMQTTLKGKYKSI